MFSNFFQLNSNLKKNKKYLNRFFLKPKLNMTYTTGVNTIDIKLRLKNLRTKAKMRSHLLINDNLFPLIKSKEILELALENLKYDSDYYNLARGKLAKDFNKDNEELLTSISDSIQKESFKFKPPKKSGGVKNLPISPIRNLIVQEAMRLILSPIYEPVFSSCSYGFRENKNHHSLFKYVNSDFHGCS